MKDQLKGPDQEIQSPASPTMEDVAHLAGVSSATVSRCLNEPARVSQATQERVAKAVRELGYAPNFGAQALAAKRTNTFGAIIPTMENAIFARGLQAFQEELGRHGITLLVSSSAYSPQLEEEQIRALVSRGADALLLIGFDRTPESYAFLDRRKKPYLVAWSYDDTQKQVSIGFDNRRAMAALTREVLLLDHRRIGFISAPRNGNDRARERGEGVLDAMKEFGLDAEALQIIETPYSIAKGAGAFKELMAVNERPSVVMCGNDVLAAGALKGARELGISVPDEVSITGFDDIEIASIVTPSLTTVHVPHRKMGRGAAMKLMAMCNGEMVMQSTELEASVMWRESLAKVKR